MSENLITVHLNNSIGAHEYTWNKSSVKTFHTFLLIHFCHHLSQNLIGAYFCLVLIEGETCFHSPKRGRYGHGKKACSVTDQQGLPTVGLALIKPISFLAIWVGVKENTIGQRPSESINDNSSVERTKSLKPVHLSECIPYPSVGWNWIIFSKVAR